MMISLSRGSRPVASRKAKRMRVAWSLPPLVIMRVARPRAASTKVGSFISTSAASGVLVRDLCSTHASRDGASNICRLGGGTERFQYV